MGSLAPHCHTIEKESESELMSFLTNEGKSVDEVKSLLTSATPAMTEPDLNVELVKAMSSLVEKCHIAPAEVQNYRTFCMFTGVKPAPSGDEDWEVWVEPTQTCRIGLNVRLQERKAPLQI